MAWRLQQGTHDHTALSTEHLKDFHEYQETSRPLSITLYSIKQNWYSSVLWTNSNGSELLNEINSLV